MIDALGTPPPVSRGPTAPEGVPVRVVAVTEAGTVRLATAEGEIEVPVSALKDLAQRLAPGLELRLGAQVAAAVRAAAATEAADPTRGVAAPPGPAQVLAETVARAVGRQDGMAKLFADLQSLQSRPAGTLPADLRAAVATVLGRRLDLDQPIDAAAVKRAVAASGLFLESKLAAGGPVPAPASDLKAALIGLQSALARHLAPPSPAGASPGSPAPSSPVGSPTAAVPAPAAGPGPVAAAPPGGAPPSATAPGVSTAAPLPALDVAGGGALPGGLPVGPAPASPRPAPLASPAGTAGAPLPREPADPAVATAGEAPRPASNAQAARPSVPGGFAPSPAGAEASLRPGPRSADDAPSPGRPGATVTTGLGSPASSVPVSLPPASGIPAAPGLGSTPAAAGAEPPLPSVTVRAAGGDPPADGPVAPALPGAAEAQMLARVLKDMVGIAEALPRLSGSAASSGEAPARAPAATPIPDERAPGPEAEARLPGMRQPPPRHDALPVAEPAARPRADMDAPIAEVARVLAEETDAALSRVVLSQYASLPPEDRPAAEPRRDPQWTFDLPILSRGETSLAQFRVERDGNGGTGAERAARPTWRIRFSLNVEPLGPVHAALSLTGDQLSVGLWAERPQAAEWLGRGVADLRDALAGANLDVDEINLASGAPPPPRPAGAGAFLDRNA